MSSQLLKDSSPDENDSAQLTRDLIGAMQTSANRQRRFWALSVVWVLMVCVFGVYFARSAREVTDNKARIRNLQDSVTNQVHQVEQAVRRVGDAEARLGLEEQRLQTMTSELENLKTAFERQSAQAATLIDRLEDVEVSLSDMLQGQARLEKVLEIARRDLQHLTARQLEFLEGEAKITDDEAAAAYLAGRVAVAKEEFEQALPDYSRAIELDPNNADYYVSRGYVLNKLDRNEEAIADLERAIQLDPNYSIAYNNRGFALDELGRSEEAIADYTKAIELDPNYATAYLNRGLALRKLGRYEEAIADYTKVIEPFPNSVIAYNNRGLALAELGRYEEAIADYAKAIELDPESAHAYVRLGTALGGLGRFDEALGAFTKAEKLDSKYVRLYEERAAVYQQMGDEERAKQDRETVARMRANDDKARDE